MTAVSVFSCKKNFSILTSSDALWTDHISSIVYFIVTRKKKQLLWKIILRAHDLRYIESKWNKGFLIFKTNLLVGDFSKIVHGTMSSLINFENMDKILLIDAEVKLNERQTRFSIFRGHQSIKGKTA